MDIADFSDKAMRASAAWALGPVAQVSKMAVPDAIFGPRRKDLVRGDIGIQLAAWFVDYLIDPQRYIDARILYPHVVGNIHFAIRQFFPDLLPEERQTLGEVVAPIAWEKIELLREARNRRKYSREERYDLLAQCKGRPRCWICGYEFDDLIVDAFLDARRIDVNLPGFVDIYKPIGLRARDCRIEIEHVRPFSGGGGDAGNLRISCGWCNTHKSSLTSLFDVSAVPPSSYDTSFGVYSLPNPFWVVRALALVKRCEHPDGCHRSTDNCEMTVEPINPLGSMNPHNIRVVCGDHHRMGHDRLRPRAQVLRMLRGGRSEPFSD